MTTPIKSQDVHWGDAGWSRDKVEKLVKFKLRTSEDVTEWPDWVWAALGSDGFSLFGTAEILGKRMPAYLTLGSEKGHVRILTPDYYAHQNGILTDNSYDSYDGFKTDPKNWKKGLGLL
jgi:hypothetical protein